MLYWKYIKCRGIGSIALVSCMEMCSPTTMRTIGYSQAVFCLFAASGGPSSSVLLSLLASVSLDTVTTLSLKAALIGAVWRVEMRAVEGGPMQWKLCQRWHPNSPNSFTPSGLAPGVNKSTRDVCKNGPPLPNTMRRIEEREWAWWQLGGDAATL